MSEKEKYDWRYENSINTGTQQLDIKTNDMKYNQWRTNLSLSNFRDTIEQCNIMNTNYQNITDQMHYDFLFHSVRKQKRFQKKKTAEDFKIQKLQEIEEKKILMISKYYKYSYRKAKEALSILTESQLETIRTKMDTGGIK